MKRLSSDVDSRHNTDGHSFREFSPSNSNKKDAKLKVEMKMVSPSTVGMLKVVADGAKQSLLNNEQKSESENDNEHNLSAGELNREGMIWDGFQWHSALNRQKAQEFRDSKFPPHLLSKLKDESVQTTLIKHAPAVQQVAAMAASGTKLNTRYPPNPMNALPLVNPSIAAACAAAAAMGDITPQQATILKLANVNKSAQMLGMVSNLSMFNVANVRNAANNAIQQQLNRLLAGTHQ